MAADPQFVASVNQLLESTLLPDTRAVASATEGLQALYKNPALIPALFQVLATQTNNAVRQLAGVELRKRISKSAKAWKNQPATVRTAIKSKLIEILTDESDDLVRNTSARVVCEIAAHDLPQNGWPELMPFLFTTAEQGSVAQRQPAVSVISTLFDMVDTDSIPGYLPQALHLFGKTLNDPESLAVRVTTVRALGRVAAQIESDDSERISLIQSSIPQMVQILQQAFDASDETGVRNILDVFEEFSASEAPFMDNYFGDLVAFFLSTAAREDLEEELRMSAISITTEMLSYNGEKFHELQLAKVMIPSIMTIVASYPFDEEDDNPASAALDLLFKLAEELPSTDVWPTLQEQLQASAQSSDPSHRAAGLVSLGNVFDGLGEIIADAKVLVFQLIGAGLKDSDPQVRCAAAWSIPYVCQAMGDEMISHHAVIVPTLLQMLTESQTQQSAAKALDRFLDILEEDTPVVNQYLQPLMETMVNYLDATPSDFLSTIIHTIGSTAQASKSDFLPYFPAVVAKLAPFLQLKDTTNNDQVQARAMTQDAMVKIATSVGAEVFRPYFADAMTTAYDAFGMDEPRLRESAAFFFGGMARIFGQEFGQFVPQIVPKLIESLRQQEHDPVAGAAGDGTTAGLPGASARTEALLNGTMDEYDDDAFVDIDGIDAAFNSVSSEIANEKRIAVATLGEVFQSTKTAFLPCLQETVQTIVPILEHYDADLRSTAMSTLFIYIETLDSIQRSGRWQPGVSIPVPVSSDVQQLIHMVLPGVLIMWEDEDERFVATQICDSLAKALNEVGPAVIATRHNKVADMAISILEKQSYAQTGGDERDEEEEDVTNVDGFASEIRLVTAAMELVGAMANVLGSDFSQALHRFLPQITKYYGPSRDVRERAVAAATLGTLAVNMKTNITEFTDPMLATLSHAVTDESSAVRTNAIYAAGVLIENSQQDLGQHYPALLTALQPALGLPSDKSLPQEAQALKDNSIGCLARMVRKNPDPLPLAQTLPLIFGGLPLLYDQAEWVPVVELAIALIANHGPVAQQHMDGILNVFAHVLSLTPNSDDDVLDDELRRQLITFIGHLNTRMPEKIQASGLSQFLA